jgi:hypothetical protein
LGEGNDPSLFLIKLDAMKIKAEYIGTEIRMRGRRWFIKEGSEAIYQEAGLSFIFEAKKPKLKKDAKNTEESADDIDRDSNGAPDVDGSILAV